MQAIDDQGGEDAKASPLVVNCIKYYILCTFAYGAFARCFLQSRKLPLLDDFFCDTKKATWQNQVTFRAEQFPTNEAVATSARMRLRDCQPVIALLL